MAKWLLKQTWLGMDTSPFLLETLWLVKTPAHASTTPQPRQPTSLLCFPVYISTNHAFCPLSTFYACTGKEQSGGLPFLQRRIAVHDDFLFLVANISKRSLTHCKSCAWSNSILPSWFSLQTWRFWRLLFAL